MDNLNETPNSFGDVPHSSFDAWTSRREVHALSTNAGAPRLPFQGWHHFKEAFAPELVARAVRESKRRLIRCGDPFGGSGTTALACQFLGVEPATIEVNPYLADLIEAKLHSYQADHLVKSLGLVVKRAYKAKPDFKRFRALPATFIEGRSKERWIFNRSIAGRIAAYLEAIDSLPDASHRRFFRIQLGGMLVSVSNVVINGKGRRYRRGWETRGVELSDVDALFTERAERAIVEAHEHRKRPRMDYTLLRGDCRQMIPEMGLLDIAIFSPPYPNSFDYTDVYNVELWMLGYLNGATANAALRNATLCSHVQIKRAFPEPPRGSRSLNGALKQLRAVRDNLWSPWIPEMVAGYFSDMSATLQLLYKQLTADGEAWAVVGDSRYGGIHVPTATILGELAPHVGFCVASIEAFRSMRSSAQQGGFEELDESLLILRKPR